MLWPEVRVDGSDVRYPVAGRIRLTLGESQNHSGPGSDHSKMKLNKATHYCRYGSLRYGATVTAVR